MFSQKSHSNPSFFGGGANADADISEAYGDSSFKNIDEAEEYESVGNHD